MRTLRALKPDFAAGLPPPLGRRGIEVTLHESMP